MRVQRCDEVAGWCAGLCVLFKLPDLPYRALVPPRPPSVGTPLVSPWSCLLPMLPPPPTTPPPSTIAILSPAQHSPSQHRYTTTSSVMFSVNLFQIFIYSGWFDCQYPLTREAEWWLVLGLAPRRAAGVDAAADGAGWSAAAAPSATASWRRSCGCRAPPWVRQHPAHINIP